MLARRPLFIASLALLACTERPLGETETGTPNATTGEPPPAATSTSTATTTATTIEPTTAVPPLPTTAATSDDSVGATDGTYVFDVLAPLPPIHGCSLDAPPGTMIAGVTNLGPFTAQRAYFGWRTFNGDPFVPMLLFVSPEADPAVEVVQTQGNTGAILHGEVATDPFDEGGWIGEWPAPFNLFDKGQIAETMKSPKVTIDALVGNWSEFDPADPPRLVGSIKGAFTGPFDAVFCDDLNVQIIVE